MLQKSKFVLPLAILFGAIASYAVYLYLEELPKRQTGQVNIPVVVAARPLGLGMYLDNNNIEVKKWPRGIVPAGYFPTLDSLRGRVVKMEISPGEPILVSKLAPEGSSGGVTSLIPPGMRAMTVSVNVVSGVGGFILPNTRVDVLATFATVASKEETTTKIILQNVKVLAVDQTYENDDNDPMTVQSVTMLVTPHDAEKLALVSNEGELQLTLRNTIDSDYLDTKGIRLSQLIGKPKPKPKPRRRVRRPVSKPKKRTPKVVEVIRSSVRSEVTFEDEE